MDKAEVLKKLNELIEKSNLRKSVIEDKLGFPKNGLSNILSGNKELPEKWVERFSNFIESFNEGQIDNEVELNGHQKEYSDFEEIHIPKIDNSEKLKTLKLTIEKIDKDFGKGSVQIMGEHPQKDVKAIPTGSYTLDNALGIGGLPKGRIVEIYGQESSGKTTIALHVIREAQKKGEICAFIDAEHSFDSEYARKIGVDIDNLLVSQPDYGEQALEVADRLIVSGAIGVIVIDSVAALVPKGELEGEMGDSKMGLQARLMSQACRKMTASISKTSSICIFINQLREQIGNMYVPYVTTGGKALKFYASVRLDVSKTGQIKDGEVVIGNRIKVKVAKNKVAPPFKIAEFDLMFGEGIDTIGEIIDLASLKNIIQKSGSWYSYEGSKLGQGKEQVKAMFKDNEEILKIIKSKL